MSAGGTFKLIANDGKADRMIMATELLNQRIKDVMCMRAKQGFADPTPTLVDLERTHILFVNSHFKPFAAIAYEYNKTRTNNGQSGFGASAQFSIPQFGDFFADMVVNVQLAATAATVGTVPALPAYIGNVNQVTTSTTSTSGINNTTSGVYTQYQYSYVDNVGNVLTVGAPASNYVRYAEFPGQRLFRQVKFEVNGNPLDSYDSTAYMFRQKFWTTPGKDIGWRRLVGQEVPHDAYSDICLFDGASTFPSPISNLIDISGAAAPSSPTNSTTTARKYSKVVNGPQTPKAIQPALDLWIPLIFWFNTDTRLSIPSVSIPYGQRFITIDIEQQANVLFTAPGNMFLQLVVQQQTSADAGTKGTAAAIAVTSVNQYVYRTPVSALNSNIDTTQQILLFDLYTNNIFVNPEIHDVYIKRIGFSLIRVYRTQANTEQVAIDNVLLSQLKWPVESMFIGMRPKYNISAANPNQYIRSSKKRFLHTSCMKTLISSHSSTYIPHQLDIL